MKLAASWFAAFCGWALSWIALMGWLAWRGHGRGIDDFDFLLWWPLAFGVIGWLAAGLPFVTWVGPRSRLLDVPWSLAAGALVSSVAYWALVGWWLTGVTYLHLVAAGIGCVALPIYARIVRTTADWEPRRRSRLVRVLAIAPIVLFATVQFGVWPLAERAAPALVFPVASLDARTRMTIRALRHVRVGDRLSELRARYPFVFERDTRAMTGNAGSVRYTIRFRDGEVSEVSVRSS
jgi:hypothetical protein